MRVGVIGAAGRMGAAVCEAVGSSDDLTLVAAVDKAACAGGAPPRSAGRLSEPVELRPDLEALSESGAQVGVDFTVAPAALEHALWCAEHRVHAVIGTTGLDGAALERISRAFQPRLGLGCLVAPNFAIGAVLMMRFAEMAARWFDTAEIVELHHDGKRDAPSGTALLTAQRMAAASERWGDDPTSEEVLPGARGGRGPAGIRIHSVRLRGLVAHQEVLLGTEAQSLTIRHDSYDRRSFMPGVLLAIRSVASRPGLTVGIEGLLAD